MSAERPAEFSHQASASELMRELKDKLLSECQELPLKEQGKLALELLDNVMNCQDKYHWLKLREAIDKRWPVKPQSIPSTFALVTLNHDDLQRAHLDDEELAQFDDDDLIEIARVVRNSFVHDIFWDEVEFVARAFLEQKQEDEEE